MIQHMIPIPEGMDTKLFVMARDAMKFIPEVVAEYFNGARPWIVADENTWRAAGEKLHSFFIASGLRPHPPLIYPAHPMIHGDMALIAPLRAAMPENALPAAVGSGTINDLVKRAAGEAGIKYLCVPTAPSVDGYTSAGAALVSDGLKKTMPCPPPYAVVADLDTLDSAPRPMFASGYADLMTKIVAGADWLIVDSLGLEPVRPDIWDLVQKDLRSHLEHPESVEGVFLGLAATGYSMQLYHDSRPASGAEHLMSHIWEMEGLEHDGESVSHGFKVAIGTLAVTALHEIVWSLSADRAASLADAPAGRGVRLAEINTLLERGCYGGSAPVEIAMAKFLEGEAAAERRKLIFEKWDVIRERVRKQLYSFDTLKQMLKNAGCPVAPEEIGLTPAQFIHGIRAAQLIRKRYTILDLLYEAGLLEPAISRLTQFFNVGQTRGV